MSTIRKSDSKPFPRSQLNPQSPSQTAFNGNSVGDAQPLCNVLPEVDWRTDPNWEANEQFMWAVQEGLDSDALENGWACHQEVDAETHQKIADTPYASTPSIPTGVTMLPLPAVHKRRGKGRSAHYDDIKKGLFIEPVAIGLRSRATPDYEVDTLIAAKIAGKTDDEIRALVIKLRAARKGVL
ncbi:MAG TPA: hypothetical protein VHB01_06945 [Nitrosospira sp.]|nr:hypothetical protein [Nitrosospira sp.]